MAYTRWDKNKWYTFWHYSSGVAHTEKGNQELALWKLGNKGEGAIIWEREFDHKTRGTFAYWEIKQMLKDGDFSKIAGFEETDRQFLIDIMHRWIDQVNAKYPRKRND